MSKTQIQTILLFRCQRVRRNSQGHFGIKPYSANLVFFLISAALIFILDLSILISSPDLAPFWYMMLLVFGIFEIFFILENFTFRKKFANSTQPVDTGIMTLIVIRDIIFVLNFIPFIQLLGMTALVFYWLDYSHYLYSFSHSPL